LAFTFGFARSAAAGEAAAARLRFLEGPAAAPAGLPGAEPAEMRVEALAFSSVPPSLGPGEDGAGLFFLRGILKSNSGDAAPAAAVDAEAAGARLLLLRLLLRLAPAFFALAMVRPNGMNK